ncbi:MAG: hypothetical protein ACI376_07330, partial [Candidatus Bruticola sp.]
APAPNMPSAPGAANGRSPVGAPAPNMPPAPGAANGRASVGAPAPNMPPAPGAANGRSPVGAPAPNMPPAPGAANGRAPVGAPAPNMPPVPAAPTPLGASGPFSLEIGDGSDSGGSSSSSKTTAERSGTASYGQDNRKAPVFEGGSSALPPENKDKRRSGEAAIPKVTWFLVAGILFLSGAVFLIMQNYNAVVDENMPQTKERQQYEIPPALIEEYSSKDPVSKKLVPNNSPYRLDVYGTTFVFESEDTMRAFADNPTKYVKPRIKIRVSKEAAADGQTQINIVGPDGRALVEGVTDGSALPQGKLDNDDGEAVNTMPETQPEAGENSDFNIPLSPKNEGSSSVPPSVSAPAESGANGQFAPSAPPAAEGVAPNPSNGQAAAPEVPAESAAPHGAPSSDGGASLYNSVPPPESGAVPPAGVSAAPNEEAVTDEEVVPPGY